VLSGSGQDGQDNLRRALKTEVEQQVAISREHVKQELCMLQLSRLQLLRPALPDEWVPVSLPHGPKAASFFKVRRSSPLPTEHLVVVSGCRVRWRAEVQALAHAGRCSCWLQVVEHL
jgi:hypothetical protein